MIPQGLRSFQRRHLSCRPRARQDPGCQREETDGRHAMFEAVVLPGGGPPPHLHTREDETFYVLEGEITFQMGGEKLAAGPGTFVHMPIGNRTHSRTRLIKPPRC